MYQLVLVIHVIVAVMVIGLVLIQQGKGADIGAAFGSGASNTVFGSQGSGGFLFKLTGGLAAIFFATSLTLGYIASSDFRAENAALVQKKMIKEAKDDLVPLPASEESTTPVNNQPASKK